MEISSGRNEKPKSYLINLIFLLCIGLGIIILDTFNKLSIPRYLAQAIIVRPIKILVKTPSVSLDYIQNSWQSRQKLSALIEAQKKEIQLLNARLSRYSSIEAENRRLKTLFDSTYTRSEPIMVAEILEDYIDGYRHVIIIDKGIDNGVFDGQVVIDENGIFGRVTKVNKKNAEVSLVTDPRQYVPIMIERNRTRGIIKGSGYNNEMDSLYFPLDTDVVIGDLLVSSGLGDAYPRGYPVARVVSILRNPESLFLSLTAEPVADTEKALEVLLLKIDKSDFFKNIDSSEKDIEENE